MIPEVYENVRVILKNSKYTEEEKIDSNNSDQ